MGMLIMKDQGFESSIVAPLEAVAKSTAKKPGRLQQIFISWFYSQSNLKFHWNKFSETSAGSHVPYRVWSRHGAYLEMNREIRSH